MSPRKLANRRCHWYKDDGTPRETYSGTGCTRYNCHFAHPSDPDWETATPSPAPPSFRNSDYERPERETNLRPPSTFSNLAAGPPASSSSSSSTFLERKATISSTRPSSIDDMSPRKDSYDKIGSSSSRQPYTSRGDSVRTESTGSLRDPRGSEKDDRRREESRSERRLSSRDSGRDEKRSDDRRSEERRPSDRRESLSGTSSRSHLPPSKDASGERRSSRAEEKRPSEKRDSESSMSSLSRASTLKAAQPSSEAMPPPPLKPSALSATPPKDSSDKVEQWLERIRVLAASVSSRIKCLKIEEEISACKRIIASRQFDEYTTQTQQRYKGHLQDAEARLQATREEMNSGVYRLVDSDFWPVPPRPPTHAANNINWKDETFTELRITVMSLKDKIKEIENAKLKPAHAEPTVLKDSIKVNSSTPTPSGSASLSTSTVPLKQSNDMDIDEPRPPKRRRISEEREQAVQPVQSVQPTTAPNGGIISSQDFDGLMDRLVALEGKLSDVENSMIQFDQNLFDAVNDRLEDRFGDLRIRPGSGSGGTDDNAGSIDTGQLTTKLQHLEAEFDQAANEIKELADTMAGLITGTTATREETALLRTENEAMKKTIAAWEERQKATEEMLNEQRSEIKALNAALTAYFSRPPDPVPPPVLPDIQMLTEALRPNIIASVREEIAPMLQHLHGDVSRTLVDHTTEITNTVMAKLLRVLKTQNAIQEFMDREKRAGSLPASVNGSGPLTRVDDASITNGTISHSPSTLKAPSLSSTSPVSQAPMTNGEVNGHVAEPAAPP